MKKRIITAFIIAIYILFIIIEMIFNKYNITVITVWLKFISVILCLHLASNGKKNSISKKDCRTVVLALIFTAISDFTLLFTQNITVGIFIFCIAHILYIYRYRPKIAKIFTAIYLGTLIACAFLYVTGINLSYMFFAGCIYAILLITASVSAFFSNLPRHNKKLACTGMVLFVLCDISVLIFNAFINTRLYKYSVYAMWIFYLPAQLLIAHSVYKKADAS